MRPPVPLHALCVLLSVASLSHAVYLKGSVQAPPPALSLVLAATGGADGSWDALLRPHVVQWGRVHPASTDATMEVIIVVTEDALAEVREAVAALLTPSNMFPISFIGLPAGAVTVSYARACNAGAQAAAGSHILLSDAAHVLPGSTLDAILAQYSTMSPSARIADWVAESEGEECVNGRRPLSRPTLHQPLVIPRALFLQAGGYDEEFTGSSLFSEVLFQQCLLSVHGVGYREARGVCAWGRTSPQPSDSLVVQKRLLAAKQAAGRLCATPLTA